MRSLIPWHCLVLVVLGTSGCDEQAASLMECGNGTLLNADENTCVVDPSALDLVCREGVQSVDITTDNQEAIAQEFAAGFASKDLQSA